MHAYRHPAAEYTWEQRNWLKLYPVIEHVLKGREKAVKHVSKLTGVERLVAFVPISSVGWVAAASRAEDVVRKAITSALLFQVGLVLFATLVGFGAAAAIARPISASIIGLRNRAFALGRGEMRKLEITSGPDELRDLGAAFNQMAEEVRSREEALSQSEQRWATTLASIGDAVIATDISGKVTFMNQVAEELTGWTSSEALSKPVADVFRIINEHTRNRVEDPVAKVLKEGMIVGLANHTVLVGKSGREIPIDDSGAPIRDRDGKFTGVVLIFRDITDRKRAEEQLRQAEKKSRLLIKHAPGMVYEIDFHRPAFKSVNDAVCDFLGYTREELLAMNPFDLLDDAGKALFRDRIRRKLAGETVPDSVEYKSKTKDGREVYGVLNMTFTYKDGNPEGAVVVAHDITDRKRAEEALRESEDRSRSVIEKTTAIILRIDPAGIITFANRRALDFFGYSAEELIGKHAVGTVVPPRESSGRDLAKMVDQIAADPDAFHTNANENMCRDGRRVWLEWTNSGIYGPDGKLKEFLSVGIDATARRQAEEALQKRTLELQHLTETLEERVKERTADLKALSSELLVAQEKERRRISQDLHDNIWQTLETIKFKIEALCGWQDGGRSEVCRQKSGEITAAISSTVATIRSMQSDLWPSVLDDIGIIATMKWYCSEFEKNNPEISIEQNVRLVEDEVPKLVKIVAYRVMREAMDNAAKRGEATRITLSMTKREHLLEIRIEDNGIGFNPEKTIMTRSPWTGLGLVSMRERTEHSGGSFAIESVEGKGTIVRALWPIGGKG
jgi:PAS domain S-box-containing protein